MNRAECTPSWIAALVAATTTFASGTDAKAQTADFARDYETPVEPSKPSPPWGVTGRVGGSLFNPALAAALGVRYAISRSWQFGLDAELNPFASLHHSSLRRGTFNAYGSAMLRVPLDYNRFSLRSTLRLGVSRMLFDLYAAPKGTTGPFVGFSLLGIDYELGNSTYLIVDPAEIAVPIPQTTGVPFAYPQYRFMLGLQWGA